MAYEYYTVDTKATGKQSFRTVSDAKSFIMANWSKIRETKHSDDFTVRIDRNLKEYGRYIKVGCKLVKID